MRIPKPHIILICLCLLSIRCAPDREVRVGLDSAHERHALFAGKRLGIITNHTAYDSDGKHIVDVFFSMETVRVTDIFLREDTVHITALFGPEHSIRGEEADGGSIPHEIDPIRNIPIYSLYGSTKKPTPEMLKDVDLLVFDIQDIGARFYTYIYTLSLAMEAAAENDISFVVLDRPNPIGGVHVEGNLLEPGFASFVGMYPIPVRHGMTVGELARMFNDEGWLANGVKADLTVIPCKHWKRSAWYDETELRWRKTSPNMPNLDVATVYPGTCLFEGTNVSEGRGTKEPFLQIGAPWLDATGVITIAQEIDLPGVAFEPVQFVPRFIEGTAPYPQFEDQTCNGIRLVVTHRNAFKPYLTGIALVKTIHDLHPGTFQWRTSHFDRLCGTDRIREMIENHRSISEIERSWQEELNRFMALRKTYLLY